MAVHLLNPDAVRQYRSPRDPDLKGSEEQKAEAAAVFLLRTLTASDLAAALDATQETVSRGDGTGFVKVDVNQRNLRLVEAALVGWRNVQDERGNSLSFEFACEGVRRPRIARKCLDLLPCWLVRELAREVMRDSMLSESEEKNSDASSEGNSTTSGEATPR